ncbi:MAG TPA: GNAT family N-acetyltransferase [Kofleriaceae bacterium]|nr:GNAT family N-acetyltransferase [Kofleriaceae bacterium]
MLTIRAAAASDDLAIAQVICATPSTWQPTAAEMRRARETFPPTLRCIALVAEQAGGVVGCASLRNDPSTNEPSRWDASVYVVPLARRAGIGRQLAAALHAALQPRASDTILASTSSLDDAGEHFVQRLGASLVEQRFESRLHPPAIVLTPHDQRTVALAQAGITLTTLAQLGAIADIEQQLYQLEIDAMLDEPTQLLGAPPSFTAWRDEYLGDNALDGVLVAIVGQQAVGLCAHATSGDTLYITTTAVARSWRKHGIATALKVASIAYARQCGMDLRTFNAAANVGILRINAALGFARVATHTRWRLQHDATC